MRLRKRFLLHNGGTATRCLEQTGCTYIRLFARCPTPQASSEGPVGWVGGGEDSRAGATQATEFKSRVLILAWVCIEYNFIDFL